MRRFAFAFSRRWVLFFLAVVVVCTATWWLGQWQFHRLADRKADNQIVRANEQRVAEPVAEVLAPGVAPRDSDEWLLVTATGVYDPSHAVIWRYRSDPDTDQAGVDLVVPLITADGTAVVVDRGFVGTDGNDALATFPDPPTGTVTVEGYVRADGTGKSTRIDAAGNTRSISSAALSTASGLRTYGGWLQLKSEDPAPESAPKAYGLPELDNGPHFFYGIQWWFFGFLAIVGFCYLLWDEYRVSRTDGDDDETGGEDPDGPPTREKSAKELAREERIMRKKALKAAYQSAYDQEKARTSK